MSEDRPPALAELKFRERAEALRNLPLPERFRYIFQENLWGNPESRSGLGASLIETNALRQEIPALIGEYGIRSLLDVPCGDFLWMSQTGIGVPYIGGDIVEELIKRNNETFGAPSRRFVHLDLTRDPLPDGQLILCRDCLVHLSFRNISAAIRNIKASRAEYFLTTTFSQVAANRDITDGDWRPLNLQRSPFSFPPPLRLIVEGVLVQPEMERGRSPLVSIPPCGRGFSRHRGLSIR